ncbi:MAG: hypothetical protein QOE90_304 [Thermoplasmata archaeon]|jgi:hypothetical protein|nr:hypothetical protein [Thermoplasmata archaeon]
MRIRFETYDGAEGAPLDVPDDAAILAPRDELVHLGETGGGMPGDARIGIGHVGHPSCQALCGLPLDEIRRMAAEEIEDVIGAAVAAFAARIRERSDVFLVIRGIAKLDAGGIHA